MDLDRSVLRPSNEYLAWFLHDAEVLGLVPMRLILPLVNLCWDRWQMGPNCWLFNHEIASSLGISESEVTDLVRTLCYRGLMLNATRFRTPAIRIPIDPVRPHADVIMADLDLLARRHYSRDTEKSEWWLDGHVHRLKRALEKARILRPEMVRHRP